MSSGSSSGASFRLDDFAEEAQETLDAARQQAGQILEDARRQVETALQGAKKQGHEKGYAEGLEAGRVDGNDRAYQEAIQQFTQKCEKTVALFEQMVVQIQARHEELETNTHSEMMKLALRIGERLFRSSLKSQPESIQTIASDCIQALSSEEEISLRVHPDDFALLMDFLPRVVETMNESPKLRILPDSKLERGDLLAQGQWGRVDATLHTQLKRFEEALGLLP